MSSFDHNPYSSLDEDTFETQELYTDDEDSLFDYDAEAEWEESKEQLSALFSLVIFPFVGKWLGKKFSFWGKKKQRMLYDPSVLKYTLFVVWGRYMKRTPFTTRFAILSTDMVNSIKKIA